jgi:hypothetical protein
MNEQHIQMGCSPPLLLDRLSQASHGSGHHGHHRSSCFALHEPERASPARNYEIHFQPLLVAKVVKFASLPCINLRLYDLCRNEAFEQRAGKAIWLAPRLHVSCSPKIFVDCSIEIEHYNSHEASVEQTKLFPVPLGLA